MEMKIYQEVRDEEIRRLEIRDGEMRHTNYAVDVTSMPLSRVNSVNSVRGHFNCGRKRNTERLIEMKTLMHPLLGLISSGLERETPFQNKKFSEIILFSESVLQ